MIKRAPFAVSWNCNSLNPSRLSILKITLSSMHPSAVALCETKRSIHSPPLSIRGFTCFDKPFSSKSGGVALVIISSFANVQVICRRRAELELSPHFLCIEVKFPFLDSPIILASLYHHRSSPSWAPIISSIQSCLGTGLPVLCLGDFNARHATWDPLCTDHFGSALLDFCLTNSCAVLNSRFSRGQATFPRSGSVIDLALSSHPSLISDLRPDSNIPLLSDHLPIRVDFCRSIVPSDSSSTFHQRRAFEKADWPRFGSTLSSVFPSVLSEVNHAIDNSSSPIVSCTAILHSVTTALTVAADSSIPMKVVGNTGG